ncbi:glycosyltransferase family 2 protein [Tissierella sp. MB52-C2]|uniref:glycosyltransferase n=1 Tax=Tissierella sp. MB52-C2 TaxID=3070999 RepID=UPI00280B6683|nr:glycosyltransferase family 2 protein [Tissierella sp. MB52-C2]WMM23277.1 glycosyltransferase family 2 protein [Tissierella sp. MB52-C2]
MDLGISVICSTNKTKMLENIINNFISQDYKEKELIIALNYDIKNLKTFSTLPENISVYNLGSKKSLGECLNFSIEKSKYPIIAKFDDDDYYGPMYLSDTIKSLYKKDIFIVGKSCIYVYFSQEKIIGINNMGRENKYVNRVHGSTLMFKKDLFHKIKFRNIDLGEDKQFCKDSLENGYKIYSTNKYHYVYMRNNENNHTWKISNDYIMKQCVDLNKVENLKEYLAISVNRAKKAYL